MRIQLSLIIFIVFLTSCKKKFNNEHLKIFKYNESAGIQSLDPAFSKDQASVWATNQLFDGLVQLDDNLNVKPSISKKWDISEDGLIYTFYLRNDVYFHDHKLFKNGKGRVVVASDFEYSFNRLKDSKLAAPGSWVLNNVKSFYAVNDTVFQIQLKSVFPAFLSLLSMQYCSVVPKEIVEATNFSRSPIGTGPFKFQMWEEGVKLVFRKNPNYFEFDGKNRLPYLDAVAITFIRDKHSAFLEFIKGNIDYVSGIDASYKDEVLTKQGKLATKYQSKFLLKTQPYLNTEYLGFLFDKDSIPIEIRKAINYGFDRKKMIKYLRNNIGTPAVNGIIPKGMPSFNDNLIGYDYNIDKAKQLVKNSKFNVDKEITLYTTSSYNDLSQFIQNSLLKIGLKIKIDVNPPSTHRQLVSESKINFFRGSWIADYPDAQNYLALFYSQNFSPNGPNYTHFNNTKFDSLYISSMNENNLEKRLSIYNEMNQLIIQNAPVVPLFYDQVLCFQQKRISNLNTNAMNLLNLKRVKKK